MLVYSAVFGKKNFARQRRSEGLPKGGKQFFLKNLQLCN